MVRQTYLDTPAVYSMAAFFPEAAMPSYSFIPDSALLLFWRRGSATVFALALPLTGCDNEPVSRHVPPRPVMTTRRYLAGNHGGQTLMTGEILPHEETIIGFRTDGRMVETTHGCGRQSSGCRAGTG